MEHDSERGAAADERREVFVSGEMMMIWYGRRLSYKMHKSRSAVAIVQADPDPSSASVVMVKVAPVVPLSLLCLRPVPQVIGLVRPLIHVVHVVAVIEGGPLGSVTEEPFTNIITSLVSGYI